MRNFRVCGLLVFCLLIVTPLAAQVESDFNGHPLQVFIEKNIDPLGTDRLQFVDSLTGDVIPVEVNGRQYTPVGREVMCFDFASNRVMLAGTDGEISEHPFIQPTANTQRIDWVIAPPRIAWTITNSDEDGNLSTITYASLLDGGDQQEILDDGPRAGIRVLPVAFNDTQTVLYMDYQPAVGDFSPYQQYAGLFGLDMDTQQVQLLPNEPGCFCGAALGAGLLVRLELVADQGGFDVHVYNLEGLVNQTIAALELDGYTQAGDLNLSPDGNRAIYALAQISDFGGANQSVRTIFVLINLDDLTQEALTDPITAFVKPVEWTEDSTALIFTSPDQDGTWKINLADGQLERIASATYLGTLK